MADGLILYSQQGAYSLAQLNVPAEKLFVAKNSLDTDEINDYALTMNEKRYRILYVGRLVEGKKVGLLLEGFSHAIKNLPNNVVLTILGDGPEKEYCQRKAQDLNLTTRIEFIQGTYDQAELASYFNTAICSVSPGYIGLSAIHSLAYGVPMIVADREPHSPEIEAITFNENALSFRANDLSDLADKICELVNLPDLARRLGENGKTKIDADYSVERMARVFREAILYAHT